MKKVVLLLSLSLALLPMTARADSCQSLIITGHPQYAPVAWAAKGKIVGAAPQMVAAIAKDLGVKKVTSKSFGTWANAQQVAKTGKADIIFGIYKNDERAGYLNYVEPPFMRDPVVIAVRKGSSFPFEKWDDLKGKNGITNEGESYGTEFDAFMSKNLTVVRAKGIDKAFRALLDKKADYLIMGMYPARKEMKKLGVGSQVEFLPKELSSFDMYVAFSKKSKCSDALKNGFAAKIKEYEAQGKVKQLLENAEKKK
jgi:polar amino acid transport system substrate-binding protein